MLTDTGGNAGSQSSTLIIRGMAVNEISLKDFVKVLWKEMRVALITATALNIVNALRLLLMYRNDPNCGLIILTLTVTLYATVIMANILGGTLPMLAKTIKLDPAIMASPLITTIVDALSLIVYMKAASYFLKLAESGVLQSAGTFLTSIF
jgi:magnesium transporter